MALSASRIVFQGETPHAHEREAIEFAIQALPNVDPYYVWALVDLLDPPTGRLYEIDLLVLGYSALYLVEIKSGPGRYEGDFQDWYRFLPGESGPHYLENPYRLANLKAKVLKSRLRAAMKTPEASPRVEPLIFLSDPNVENRLRTDGQNGVITRGTFLDALKHHSFPGSPANWRAEPISRPVMHEIAQAMKAIGIRPRKAKLMVGSYQLGEILEDGPGYQDRAAVHRDQKSFTRRARTYLVPQQTSVERRQQLRRAADREAQLLWDVREHPSILRISDFVADAELGPTVLFDAFEGALPLDAFVRKEPKLDVSERIGIIEQVGRALAFCHRKGVVHGAVCPQSVLVRRAPGTRAIETRLFNFQLGAGERVEGTSHWTALTTEPWLIYQAPELREDPSTRMPSIDMFGLGALGYFLLTGREPGASRAEVEQRLQNDGCLDPRRVADDIGHDIAEQIAFATRRSPIERADDVAEWIELLLDVSTKPDEPRPPEPNPLEAKKGDRLGGDLVVEDILGHGATSRVLKVERESDGRSYALKVSLSPDFDVRLREECAVLERLRHPRIVQYVEKRTLGGRFCLLLSLAGPETLHRHLAREGTVSLDLASRYGEDLLSALAYLEVVEVMHRDIKPANIGVGIISKDAAHLTLFDFSLANAPAKEVQIGTAAYRDPFLRARGAWDYAAERWSAAVTLHEMLTGVRPSYVGLGEDGQLILAPERFDAAVRDALIAFFERALHPDVERRFTSAQEMSRAWVSAFERVQASIEDQADTTGDLSETSFDVLFSPERLKAISPQTAIEALPLSPRARNALDRAGLRVASDLLRLPDNRLSAIRGIGRSVAREILELRNRWKHLQGDVQEDATPFFVGYAGEDFALALAGVELPTVGALKNAGVRSLGGLASMPKILVEGLSARHGFDAGALHRLLDAETRKANEREHPTTLEGWIDALLAKQKKGNAHIRELFGLEGPFAGKLGTSVRELAEALEVTAPAIYIALAKCRDVWKKHPALAELRARCRAVVEAKGGAATLEGAAADLLAVLPHDRGAPSELLRARAGALFRLIAEVDKEEEGALAYLRLHDSQAWLVIGDERAKALRELGEAADQLAARPVLASPSEAERALRDVADGTPFAGLAIDRLAELAALASTSAARSSRLEIYPRGLSAARAIELSSSVLKPGLAPAEIRERVLARYAESEALPDRPALDPLLEAQGLSFDAASGKYTRPNISEGTGLETRVSTSMASLVSSELPRGPAIEADDVAFDRFERSVRLALERRSFRVLGVTADRANQAALALSARHGLQVVPFDRVLLGAIHRQMEKAKITQEDVVHIADREGEGGKNWNHLLRLVNAAVEDVARELLPPKEPTLFVQVGLLARYRLEGFLHTLMEAAKRPECPAIFVLVPAHDTGGLPRINGELTFPGLLASQAEWIPKAWLRRARPNAA
ncbi:MAG: BREX system serine/threonine kinase PglW [Deltaproteobacteria bacterium]|nr:BREX system serine/threonine kinase PglW [Deltaproteobacteria bacterium]